MDEEEYEHSSFAAQYGLQERNRVLVWLERIFQARKAAYLTAFILGGLLGWWAEFYAAPAVFLLVYFAVTKIMDSFKTRNYTLIIEARLQGQRIECELFEEDIIVPNSGVRTRMVPNQCLERGRAVVWGDTTPMVPARNTLIVDYYEELPNGKILLFAPEDNNFSNFAMYSRANPELAAEMREIGKIRQDNKDLVAVLVQGYHDGMIPKEKMARFLADFKQVESKLGNTAAARRDIWDYYKTAVPNLRKQINVLIQDMEARAVGYAAQMLHQVYDHPMGREEHERIEALINGGGGRSYEERLEYLQQEGIKNEAREKQADLLKDVGVVRA